MEKVTQSTEKEEWLFRYFSGQFNAGEEKELLEWLDADPAHRTSLAAAADRWALLHAPRFAAGRRRNFETHFPALCAARTPAAGQNPFRRLTSHPAFRTAAAFALFVAVGALAYQAGRRYAPKTIPLSAVFEASTPLGSKTRLLLPDSTVVWLNAGSSLKCTGGFVAAARTAAGENTRGKATGLFGRAANDAAAGQSRPGQEEAPREVWLQGEAYFEVSPDTLRPFIVRSEKLRVRVTGTRFDVRAYPDEETVDVSLVSGKVYVRPDDAESGDAAADRPNTKRDAGHATCAASPKAENAAPEARNTRAAFRGSRPTRKEVELAPERMLSYNKETNCVQVSRISGADALAWTEGRLKFRDRPFSRIAKDLERKFNTPIVVGSRTLAGEIFTGSFPAALSLDEILREIDVEHKYAWRREGGALVIRDKKTNNVNKN